MNKYLKQIIILFFIIIFSNVLVDIGDEEQRYFTNPVRYFGTALILSIIGGYLIQRINDATSKPKD